MRETSAELFLFQGQKGDPGLSPGKAHDGAKVGFEGPQVLGRGSEPWGQVWKGQRWLGFQPGSPLAFPYTKPRASSYCLLRLQPTKPTEDFPKDILGECPFA